VTPFKHLERIADVLDELRRLYSLDLSARGIVQEVGTEEGEILYDDRSPGDEFEQAVDAKDYDDAEEKARHLDYLRELEKEALRLFTPSGFVPGAGPEGAEDPPPPSEDNGVGGEGPPGSAEGPGSSPKQEG
jgi:hypothetical protein